MVNLLLSACSDMLSGHITHDEKLRSASIPLGQFLVRYQATDASLPALKITHNKSENKVLWQTVPGESFVMGGKGKETIHEVKGSFFIDDETQDLCEDQTVTRLTVINDALVFRGDLACQSGKSIGYVFTLKPHSSNQLSFSAELDDTSYNRIYLNYASEKDESFYGFGEQFTYFDQKGKKLPIFIMEQGIGRGSQPFTLLVDINASAGGKWHTSYAGVPHYMTSKMRSLFLETSEYSSFDMTADNQVQVALFSHSIKGRIINGDTPLALIEEYTTYSGRMRELPDWIHDGAILGMQGGTEKVMARYQQMKDKKGAVAGLWLQDWVGQRKTSFGKQLWWNWELDNNRYENWSNMLAGLKKDDVHVLTYINPFFAQVDDKPHVKRNQFSELLEQGFLVQTQNGEPYLIENTSFSAGLIDLSNPEARSWIKQVIKDELIASGASGWMADFGEALPYDAKLHSGTPVKSHNRYAEEWQQVNREAIDEAGRSDDIVFFSRSGYTKSPGLTTLFWLGDQLVTWDKYDGIKTAVTGLLSSGLSGYSLNHSDIGGYTTVPSPASWLIGHRYRSKELMQRWTELNAFTTIFRTHEGNRPEANHQFNTDEETLDHFARFANIYKAWGGYRKQLVKEAAQKGYPVVRHPWVHYPNDAAVRLLDYQFMVGADFMVAPVLDPETSSVDVYLPKGDWTHLFTGEVYRHTQGKSITVAAPIGTPAVFYKTGSKPGERFRQSLLENGLIES
ncbi:MAG: alpha-glucosidase [Halioglobus sp.]